MRTSANTRPRTPSQLMRIVDVTLYIASFGLIDLYPRDERLTVHDFCRTARR